MKKNEYILLGNLLIQFLWIAVSITIAIILARKWVPDNYIFVVSGVLTIVFYAAFNLLGHIFDEFRHALKDPDVKVASALHMNIKRYKKYKKLYDEHWDKMMDYGSHSKEAEDFFRLYVMPNIDNPNEWRRYQDYRGMLKRKEHEEEIRKYL